MLWVSSKTYFSWIGRRFTELQNIHLKLTTTMLPNHKLMSIIITYLMRYVMVTPQENHKCLIESVRNLRFKGIMERFGMVFLHDLDVQSCKLREIDHQDATELTEIGGRTVKHKENITRPWQLCNSHDQDDFPWGRALSWQRVVDLLATECSTFLRPWEFIHRQEDDRAFISLFKVFTRDIWMSIGSHVVESNRLPSPNHLEEAMRTWTPQKVEQILGKDKCHFLPSTHGLMGKYPKNAFSKSFADMRSIFFPGLDINIRKDSLWINYTHQGAYIDIYHGYLKRWTEDDIKRLNNYLDTTFANLQCLPASKPPDASRTVIWSAVRGKIQFVTNSSFYRVEEVSGQKAHERAGPTRPQTSSRQLQTRIQGAHGALAGVQRRARVRQKSLKSRNKRHPPQTRQHKSYK